MHRIRSFERELGGQFGSLGTHHNCGDSLVKFFQSLAIWVWAAVATRLVIRLSLALALIAAKASGKTNRHTTTRDA